jgi:hypothetical protein
MSEAPQILSPVRVSEQKDDLPEGLTKVLESRTFQKCPSLRGLLVYLWQHREDSISEYAIATEALGRGAYFDAKTDATVRVQISRLRQRLDKFYEEEGKDNPERLSIPLGSHQIHIEVSETIIQAPEEETLPPARRLGRFTIFLAAATVLLATICITEGVLLLKARRAVSAPPVESSWVWRNFFSNGRKTRIILPNPTFFSFRAGPDYNSIMFRDTGINDFSKHPSSPAFDLLTKQLGRPTLAENYTVTSDTFASVRLARYLDKVGFQTEVQSSADAPLEALDSENVIALGTFGTLNALKPYLDQMNFELGPHEEYIDIRMPGPGEPSRINTVHLSPGREISPGVIAFLPSQNGRSHLAVLGARYTSALVTFLTSSEGLEQLERLWKSKGSPESFEVIVESEWGGRGLVRSWPIALHPHKNKA